jgi:hypothetical protein
MSNTKAILGLIAVLVLALLVHAIIGCRQNFTEGLEINNSNDTSKLQINEIPANGQASGQVATAVNQAQSTQTPSTLSSAAVNAAAANTTSPPPALQSTPSTVSAGTGIMSGIHNALTSSGTTTAPSTTTTDTTSTTTSGFTNLFESEYSTPYWNNQSNMNFFANTKFKPECCKNSDYSNSQGCACLNNKQKKYLSDRANNNNPNKPFYFF